MFKTHIICYSVYIVLSLFALLFDGQYLKEKKRKTRQKKQGRGADRKRWILIRNLVSASHFTHIILFNPIQLSSSPAVHKWGNPSPQRLSSSTTQVERGKKNQRLNPDLPDLKISALLLNFVREHILKLIGNWFLHMSQSAL